jgi:hypothetical protein
MSPLLLNIILEVLANALRQGKAILKSIKIRGDEIKLPSFINDMVVYVKIRKQLKTSWNKQVIEQGCKIQD